MSFTKKYEQIFKRIIPDPFVIAILLTVAVFFWAWSRGNDSWSLAALSTTADAWYQGVWNTNGLVFTVQMMLMLMLGHVLALSKPVDKFLNRVLKVVTNGTKAAVLIVLVTLLVSFFNWGLGLIVGAILTKKVGDYSQQNNIAVNYGLLGACGYIGLMVWHGGFSGSALVKSADLGHLQALLPARSAELPSQLPLTETVFSGANLLVWVALLILLPAVAAILSKKVNTSDLSLNLVSEEESKGEDYIPSGAENLTYSKWVGLAVGILFLCYLLIVILSSPTPWRLGFVNTDFINFLLFGLALLFHGSIHSFLKSSGEAIQGVTGILIQFPLYFGIMGIMSNSGIVAEVSETLASITNEKNYQMLTFLTSGALNIFVPSGGGQWAIQGPIILESVQQNGFNLSNSILAMAYGDQLTNMLQPFWALPLLGITKLKAKEILPYTLIFMIVGFIVYTTAIYLVF